MKKSFRKILLSAIIMIVAMCAFSMSTLAADGIETKINALRSKYPDGYFWNHQVTANSNNGDQLMSRWDESFSQSVTSTPCKTHNGTAYVGQYDCNFFDGGIQCFGFARRVFYDIFGVRVSNMTTRYDTSNIQVGDHIRINDNTHSAVVIARNGNTLTLVEANLDKSGPSYNCKIRWGATCDISKVTYFQHASNYDTVKGDYWKNKSTKVNLGDDFYARIVNTGMDKPLTVQSDDNVVLYERKNTTDQIWHFTRNSDNTYNIINVSNNKALDVYDASSAVSTNLWTWPHDGNPAQKWSVYGSEGKYIFSADCTECVIDVSGAISTNGTNILMYTKNDSIAQLYTIEKIPSPLKPSLTVNSILGSVGSVTFMWTKDSNATSYDLKIMKNGVTYKTISAVPYKTMPALSLVSYTLSLPSGDYSAVLTAKNELHSTSSDAKSFTVNIDKCASGHTYTSKVTKAATCSATGVKTYTCSVCSATKTETIAKTAHKYGEYKPACDFSNFPQDTQVRTCSVCKATQKATYTKKYSDSNSGVTTGSSYVKVVLDETELEDIGGVKFYLYDTDTKEYVRVEDNKIEKSFDEETWSNIYKIKGLKANTEYTVLTVLYGCWEWDGEPGEKMEDDIYSVKKSTVKTLSSDTLGTTSSITATKTATSVTLNWNAVPGADGYRVYRKTSSGWLTLGHTTRLTYTENSLKANTKYTYAVKAYVLDGATKVFAPKYKTLDVTTSKAALGTTSKITATKTTSSVTLKWNKVTGATGYRVYQKTASGWKTLANTTKLTYTVKSLKAGTKYTFAIRAYVTKSGKMTLAPKYKTLDVTTTSSSAKPAQVKNLKATPTATTVKLTWSKVSGVKGYYVFSYNSKTKKYTSLGKTTGTSYTVKNCKANTAYQYAVQAYKVSGGKNVFGKVSSVVKVTTLLATPTVKISSTKGKANLTWNDIAGESGYAIYMATSKSGKYTHLANYKANSTKATKSKLTSGKTYYFKIRAYKTVNGTKTYGGYSAVKSVKIK